MSGQLLETFGNFLLVTLISTLICFTRVAAKSDPILMRLELKQEAVAFSKLNLKLRFCCLDVLTYLLLLNKKLFDNQLVLKEQCLA